MIGRHYPDNLITPVELIQLSDIFDCRKVKVVLLSIFSCDQISTMTIAILKSKLVSYAPHASMAGRRC